MKDDRFPNEQQAASKTAVINPFALAEYVTGRSIDWKSMDNIPAFLEAVLQTPYHELFDPKFDGPLYFGFKVSNSGRLERHRSEIFNVKMELRGNDLEMPIETISSVKKLGDLAQHFRLDDIADLKVISAEVSHANALQISIRVPDRERLQMLKKVFPNELLNSITLDPDLEIKVVDDWTPANATWQDKGDFFKETAEYFDPVQGAVANCYFIAALSAVAWAVPHRIAHKTRATGPSQPQFYNSINFYKPDTGGTIDKEIEVSDTVPVSNTSGNLIYCRSSESGELWPAIYEKAFAKLTTGTSSDHPDITATGWGDPVYATAQLTGNSRYYYGNSGKTGDQLWDIVRANSVSRRTVNPMTCWTYGTAPSGLSYSSANIVGSHAYTVLGWDYRSGKKYIVLRNPWGQTEATVGVHSGTVYMYDISWWRPIAMTNPDGVFAIEADIFQQYFAGMGVVQ